MTEFSTESDRRRFLKTIAKLFFLVLSVLAGVVYLLFAYPVKIRKKKTVYVYACDEDELPVRGVRQYYIQSPLSGKTAGRKIFIVKTDTKLFSLLPVCTHLGCLVTWQRPAERFVCPCHGGQYDTDGKVVAGPPPGPLNRLPLKIKDGKVLVGLRI